MDRSNIPSMGLLYILIVIVLMYLIFMLLLLAELKIRY
nr:MAG TPA: hypothetical protein [Bacteriophage sp.]